MADSIITEIARHKMIEARTGERALPKIVGFAFGSGGVDEDGNAIAPGISDYHLKKEIYRKQIDKYEMLSTTSCVYYCTLAENELAGKDISEIALYDDDGDLVAIKTFRQKSKDDDVAMTFEVEDKF